MKNLLLVSLALLASLFVTSCDDDDPADVAEDCRREAAFLVDDFDVCATGTYMRNAASTQVTLMGENNEMITISVAGIEEGGYNIEVGDAIYTLDGEAYLALSGGRLDITDIINDMDATFSFRAQSAGGAIVAITRGVIEDLPPR